MPLDKPKSKEEISHESIIRQRTGDHIRLKRTELGMTKQKFAGLLEVSTNTIRSWESGRVFPSRPNIERLLELFELDLTDFTKEYLRPPSQESPFNPLKSINSMEPRFIENIGRQIIRRRLEWVMTQQELAEHLGVSGDTVDKWEREKLTPSELSLYRVFKWFAEDIPDTRVKRDKGIGKVIKKRRQEWAMSTLGLARHLGVCFGTVRDWELGNSIPQSSSMVRLSEWFAEEIPESPNIQVDCADLGKRIKDKRQERGMRQVDLARHLDVDANTVSRWERGGRIRDLSKLERLSNWLTGSVHVNPIEWSNNIGERTEESCQEKGMNLRDRNASGG